MTRLITSSAIALMVIFGILVSGMAHADGKTERYEVTITNITKGQIFSNPIVISHNKDFKLFKLGYPAPVGLPDLAEDGMTGPLSDYLDGLDSVFQYITAASAVMPGASVTVEIETRKRFRYLSLAGMLVSTNDAFFAVRGLAVHKKYGSTAAALAYDAGSEVNSEMCEFIPGPPCGHPGVRDTNGAEGYIYIHSGIHGNSDLDPAEADWLNPVAIVSVQRVK